MSKFIFEPAATTCLPVQGSEQTYPIRRVYCVGRNYVEHAKEMGFTGREPPFFFLKPADSVVVVPPNETVSIDYPPGSKNLHHEIELVVAIGKGGKNIAAADARSHVFAYAVGLDMTRRDLQGEAKKLGRPWEIGKAFDQSAPTGYLVPADKVSNIEQSKITVSVDGTERQSATIAELIWNIDEIIEHLSKYWELQPGDLIFTGTPAGVAAVERGNTMLGEVEGIGKISVKIAT